VPGREWWQPEAPAAAVSDTGASSGVAFTALMAFTFILLFAPQEYVPALGAIRVAFLAAATAIVAEAVHRMLARRPLFTGAPELRLIGALVAWSLLTVPLSLWPGGSVRFLLSRYLKTVAIFWLLVSTIDTRARLRQVAWMLVLLSVPLSATAVHNFATGAFIALAPGRIVGYGAPLTSNPNDLALTLNILIPLAAGLFVSSSGFGRRALLAGIVALDVIGVVVTFSRAGLLTLVAIAGVYLVKLVRAGRPGWAVAAMAILVCSVPLLPPGYLARLSTIARPESDPTGSAQERWSDMVVATRLMLTHPLGSGLGANTLALNQERGTTWRPVHNVYLEYGVELGLPGLTLFLMLMRRCYRRVRDVERQGAGEPALADVVHLAASLRVSLFAFALAAFFHPVGYEFYFYYLGGLAVGAHEIFTRAIASADAQPADEGAPSDAAGTLSVADGVSA
jgi:putative inorganic carbon (HCO3(-)) transporter